MIHIRRAGPLDAMPLADLLNEIFTADPTAALTGPVTPRDIRNRMQADRSIWHLAEDDSGALKGFQWIAPHPDLPPDAISIASFVKTGASGLAIGSALFKATSQVARDMGYAKIDAIIRADNTGGLAYYQSRGFEDIKVLPDYRLADGTSATRIWKRFWL